MSYTIERIVNGPLEENCWFITDPKTNHCVAIDPGDEAGVLIEHLGKRVLDGVLLTHGHFDHVGAAEELADYGSALVYIHADETELLAAVPEHARQLGLEGFTSPKEDLTFKDGDVLEVGDFTFQVIGTPGHTAGSSCLLLIDPQTGQQHLFSGDTLFRYDIGRTDFPESRPELMGESLMKLAQLDPTTIVYPGHGPTTTIGDETAH
ncbi:MAG: MBL fold metallo-hydrolase [Actinomycetia bacterium]|nr:MBL fold metallo-hydrolase [Actinomycetes bacterium]